MHAFRGSTPLDRAKLATYLAKENARAKEKKKSQSPERPDSNTATSRRIERKTKSGRVPVGRYNLAYNSRVQKELVVPVDPFRVRTKVPGVALQITLPHT